MHSFEVSLGYESVDRTTFRASLKRYVGQRFHTPMKLQKNAFNSQMNVGEEILTTGHMIPWGLIIHQQRYRPSDSN